MMGGRTCERTCVNFVAEWWSKRPRCVACRRSCENRGMNCTTRHRFESEVSVKRKLEYNGLLVEELSWQLPCGRPIQIGTGHAEWHPFTRSGRCIIRLLLSGVSAPSAAYCDSGRRPTQTCRWRESPDAGHPGNRARRAAHAGICCRYRPAGGVSHRRPYTKIRLPRGRHIHQPIPACAALRALLPG